MTWSGRQRRMLDAMGVRVWAPLAEAAVAAPVLAVVSNEPPSSDIRLPRAPTPATPATPARPVALREVLAAPAAPSNSTARAQEIAGMDWTTLQAAVADCTACGLCATRKQTVFGVGHPKAEWMIIGEAPGEQEDQQGEPFVGAAGQLLDQMLRALGLSRTPAAPPMFARPGASQEARAPDDDGDPARRVFIANTLKCRPPRNRNPEPAELDACEPFLRRQVELVRPRVILLMGRFAVKSMLKTDEAIGRLRGRLHRYEGTPVVVTYHPAYLLRNLPDKAKAWSDLCFAARTLDEARSAG